MLLAFMAALVAPVSTNQRVGGWLIYPDNGYCIMANSFTDDGGNNSLISFRYNSKMRHVQLMFSDPATKALKQDDKRKMLLLFYNGLQKYDEGWGQQEFRVVKTKDIETAFLLTLEDSVLPDIAKSEAIAFFYGKIVVQAFPLKGANLAVPALKKCALDEQSLHPTDPFAE